MLSIGIGFDATRRAAVRQGHAAPITTVEWSPDGERLATGAYDGSILIWDEAGSSVSRAFFHPRLVNGIRWSHDGRLLASASADGTCRLWDVEAGECVLVLARHTDDVVDAAWAADDRLLVTVAQDGTGRVWGTESGELLDAVLLHRNHCMSVDWDAVTGLIATCGEDSTIRVWDAEGNLVADCPQPGDLESCRWAPEGRLVAGACDSGSVRVLESDGKVVAELGPLHSAAKCVAWGPDGRHVAVGTYDSACTVYELASGRALVRFHGPRVWPRSVHWSAGGDRIAVGTFDAVPAILDVAPFLDGSTNGKERKAPARVVRPGRPTSGINALAPAGDGGILLGADDGLLWRWQPRGDERPETVGGAPGGSLVNTAAWQPERRLIAYGTFAGEVTVLAPTNGKRPLTVEAGSPVNQVVWSPDGSLLAVATYHGVVHLVRADGESLTVERSVEAHDAAVKGVAWLDEATLVTAATDRLSKVISVTGETLVVLSGHGNLINGVAVATGEGPRLVATVSRDRTARVWDPETGACLRTLCGHDESVKSVAWKPGSSRIVLTGSYDFDARLWDLEADEEDARFSIPLRRHRNGVGAVAWWNDLPVTSSWDTTVAVWEVVDGTPRVVSEIALADSEARRGAA